MTVDPKRAFPYHLLYYYLFSSRQPGVVFQRSTVRPVVVNGQTDNASGEPALSVRLLSVVGLGLEYEPAVGF